MMEADEFKEKVSVLMAQDTRGWIVDGDYEALGMLIPDSATDIICGYLRGSVTLPIDNFLCNRQ